MNSSKKALLISVFLTLGLYSYTANAYHDDIPHSDDPIEESQLSENTDPSADQDYMVMAKEFFTSVYFIGLADPYLVAWYWGFHFLYSGDEPAEIQLAEHKNLLMERWGGDSMAYKAGIATAFFLLLFATFKMFVGIRMLFGY